MAPPLLRVQNLKALFLSLLGLVFYFFPVFPLAVPQVTVLSKEIHCVALSPFLEGMSQSDPPCPAGKGQWWPGRVSAVLADNVLHQSSSELLG